ncbi:hypothetical protein AVEN_147731-1 [Araneus ventricosus]|uniref:Secreted protein n=1 Tax=Araneus ventricosus TaxID=182803 RepID=A0A4Y2MN19_ARAVE|nr:hypothetical protein AVEN_147731-1 [Araneus ventricosus]
MLSAFLLLSQKIVALLITPLTSSTTSCCEAQWNFVISSVFSFWLWPSSILSILFLSISNLIILVQDNLVVCRLHRNCLKHLQVTFDNVLQPQLPPRRSQGSLPTYFRSSCDRKQYGSNIFETL